MYMYFIKINVHAALSILQCHVQCHDIVPVQKAPIALRAVLSHRYTDTLSQNGWVWHSPVLDDTHAGCSG